MFGWIERWRQRRQQRERYLLRFWDGQRWRYGDPFAIWRALANHPEANLETMLELADAGQEPETTIVVGAICEAFGVRRWDGRRGLTDWQVLELPALLVELFETVKKNISPGSNSAESTDSGSATSLDSPADRPSFSSPSGSTGPESSTDGPTTPPPPSDTA